MQQWFFLEDAENSRIRNMSGDSIDKSEVTTEDGGFYPHRSWSFRVRVPKLRREEVVCVTGDIPELGNWKVEKCVPLNLEDGSDDMWSALIQIPGKQRIHYRYCVCVLIEKGKNVLVRHWETNIYPRDIKSEELNSDICREPDVYGEYNNDTKIDKGWLTNGTILQLKLFKDPFVFFRNQYKNRKIYVKVTTVNLPQTLSNSFDESLSIDYFDADDDLIHNYTEVAYLNDSCTLRSQGQFGESFSHGDMIIYQSYIDCLSMTAILLDLYVYSSKRTEGEPPYRAGFAYLLPSTFKHSEGTIVLPLTSTKHRPLGEMRLEYLIIKPLPSIQCDMSVSYMRHWKVSKQGLNVGHRGAGSSFKSEATQSSEIRENTIASMKTAISHGADFVEFDVQLSKDLVPVIYHDYHVCIAMKRKKDFTDSDMFELPLKDLSLDQLRLLKVYHLTEGKSKISRFFDEDLEEHQPFPTLQSALELLNPFCGFNIEIKWTMELLDGSFELQDAFDLNLYVDTILEVVFRCADQRRIVFSCFNPDICTALRYKQNKYPVLFLTQGDTDKYPRYEDPRCWTVKSAINFVNVIEILGLNAHTEDILKDPSVVDLARHAGIVLFCWGDDTSDHTKIQYLKDLGVHGIIYDRIYQYLNKDIKESIYLLEARESQKQLIELAAIRTEKESIAEDIKRTLDVENMRIEDNVSKATSLQSLESTN